MKNDQARLYAYNSYKRFDRRLEEEAKRREPNISKMVRLLLEDGINTLGEREKLENCLFSKKMVARMRCILSFKFIGKSQKINHINLIFYYNCIKKAYFLLKFF